MYFSFSVFPHVPSPLPIAQRCLQLAQYTGIVRLVPLICWSKMAPTVISFLQQGVVFCFLQITSFL